MTVCKAHNWHIENSKNSFSSRAVKITRTVCVFCIAAHDVTKNFCCFVCVSYGAVRVVIRRQFL